MKAIIFSALWLLLLCEIKSAIIKTEDPIAFFKYITQCAYNSTDQDYWLTKTLEVNYYMNTE